MENSKLLDKFFTTSLEHKLLEKTPFDLITWDQCVHNINRNFVDDLYIRLLGDFSIVTHDVSEFDQVKIISDQIKKSNPNCSQNAHMYCNISITGKTFGMHVDTQDTWIWQCAGVTKWALHYHIDAYHSYNGVVVHELNPGDMLYIPKGVYHTTKPLTPRFSISFSINDAK